MTEEKGKKNGDCDKFITAVLGMDLRCNCIGCIRRIRKACFSLPGVAAVREEAKCNKVYVSGVFDAVKLKERVEMRTMKKVELVSPVIPKKKGDEAKSGNADQDKNKNHKKEPAVTTVVLKMSWHCQGCTHKIHKIISAYKGVQRVQMDKAKELITVMGTVEPKLLVESLKKRLKRPVQIVPEKKEKEEKNNQNQQQQQQQKQQQQQEGGKKKGGGDGGAQDGKATAENMGTTKVEYFMVGTGYGCREASSGYVVDVFYAPQMFSEDNPNGCSIM